MRLVNSLHKTVWTSGLLQRLPETFITCSLKGFHLTQTVCESLFCCTFHLTLPSCEQVLQKSGLNHIKSSIALQKQFSSKFPNWAAAYFSHKNFCRGWAQWIMMVYKGMDGCFSGLWKRDIICIIELPENWSLPEPVMWPHTDRYPCITL